MCVILICMVVHHIISIYVFIISLLYVICIYFVYSRWRIKDVGVVEVEVDEMVDVDADMDEIHLVFYVLLYSQYHLIPTLSRHHHHHHHH